MRWLGAIVILLIGYGIISRGGGSLTITEKAIQVEVTDEVDKAEVDSPPTKLSNKKKSIVERAVVKATKLKPLVVTVERRDEPIKKLTLREKLESYDLVTKALDKVKKFKIPNGELVDEYSFREDYNVETREDENGGTIARYMKDNGKVFSESYRNGDFYMSRSFSENGGIKKFSLSETSEKSLHASFDNSGLLKSQGYTFEDLYFKQKYDKNSKAKSSTVHDRYTGESTTFDDYFESAEGSKL